MTTKIKRLEKAKRAAYKKWHSAAMLAVKRATAARIKADQVCFSSSLRRTYERTTLALERARGKNA